MRETLNFAMALLIGVLFIFGIAGIYMGTWDIAQWPENVRANVTIISAIWGVLVLMGVSS